ncbi:MAG: hypothetical protein FWF60_05020 [Oscillospiraceae bacterium]|nr:hypothetical protein [Oscillospiraceae bacterium]
MKKRILAIALALAMLLPAFAMGASAATPEEEAQALLAQTRAIFDSGKYTLKACGTSPFNGKPTPVVFVSDGSHSAFEATMDWGSMMQATGTDQVTSMFQGWMMWLLFGSKVRFISEPDKSLLVFLDRRFYMVTEPSGIPLYGAALFALPDFTEMTVSEPVVGGKKYLCAALSDDNGVTTSYYYLNGQLKRITLSGADYEDAAFEIDTLSASADQSYFSTKWMLKLSVSGLINLIPSSILN